MSLFRDQAVVLRTIKLGEADRIVNFLTPEHGKVRAVAKGIRKTKSKFGGRLEPTSHIAAQFFEGRGELDIVTQAETIQTFRHVKEDLTRLTAATAVLEAVDQVAQEGEANQRRFDMLVGALRALDTQWSPALVGAFFWRLLASEGFEPVVDLCVRCGQDGPFERFDTHEGGVVCGNCGGGSRVSPAALEFLQRVLGGDLVGVLAEPASAALAELDELATRAMEHHLERRLRTPRGY